MKTALKMNYRKSTKGTHVYDAAPDEYDTAAVKTVYVARAAIPSVPNTITLTLEWEDKR